MNKTTSARNDGYFIFFSLIALLTTVGLVWNNSTDFILAACATILLGLLLLIYLISVCKKPTHILFCMSAGVVTGAVTIQITYFPLLVLLTSHRFENLYALFGAGVPAVSAAIVITRFMQSGYLSKN